MVFASLNPVPLASIIHDDPALGSTITKYTISKIKRDLEKSGWKAAQSP
jgi:hypothetical protein